MNTSPQNKPYFYDVTLRDGNQALKNPWNLQEKELVFHQLIKLGVQGIEVGFSGSSDMDFAACAHLSNIAPDDVTISGLARAVERDINKVWEAIQGCAQPRIHTFITTSRYNMEHVLRKPPEEVIEIARKAVGMCANVMKGKGTIQFSAEHFGDCADNMEFVLEVFDAVVKEGAHVINLPNTVERYRPTLFTNMVKEVVDFLPPEVTVAVHNHNDLGMATATTVESYFTGATQLETTINGLGERAGNTNMFEVACALYNCEVDVPLNFPEIYESALLMSEWSGIPIPEKSPLVGHDVVAHRSGIHQDGAIKTKGKEKGAYRAIDSALIGRKEGDRLKFTSQSGKTAVFELINQSGLPISLEEAGYLQPLLKKASEDKGELTQENIISIYDEHILNVEGPLEFVDLESDSHRKTFTFKLKYEGEAKTLTAQGTGPVEACHGALAQMGLDFHLLEYKQAALDVEHKDFAAYAISEISLQGKHSDGSRYTVKGRAKDLDTVKANVKAMVNGVNLLFRKKI